MVTLVWGGGEGVLGEGSPPPLVFNYSKEALPGRHHPDTSSKSSRKRAARGASTTSGAASGSLGAEADTEALLPVLRGCRRGRWGGLTTSSSCVASTVSA